jgi:hypothetical protein
MAYTPSILAVTYYEQDTLPIKWPLKCPSLPDNLELSDFIAFPFCSDLGNDNDSLSKYVAQ